MKALIDASDEELAERTRKGLGRFDEMWNVTLSTVAGKLHVEADGVVADI